MSDLHAKIAAVVPAIARGQVWCRTCGATKRVDGAECLRSGWPECCGCTMTIDDPGAKPGERGGGAMTIENLKAGLEILIREGAAGYCIAAEHDVLYAGQEFAKVSEAGRVELEALGWKWNGDAWRAFV